MALQCVTNCKYAVGQQKKTRPKNM